MKTLIPILLILIALGINRAQAQTSSSLSGDQQSAIEKAILQEMSESGTPGASMAIIHEGLPVYRKAFGLANTLTSAPVNDSTYFQVASITKMFTALALVSELEKAGISLSESIGKTVDGLSPGVSQLTYHQLLSHTGGLVDYWPGPGEAHMGVFTFFKAHGDRLLFAGPGEVFSYSNIGYGLAGLALEKLTGKPYPDAIRDLILIPLGLDHTTFDFYAVACNPFSAGHVPVPESPVPVPYIMDVSCPLIQPAGGLYSTIGDMERFALFLMNRGELDGRQIFERSIFDQVSGRHAERFTLGNSPYDFLSFPGNAYGYGLFTFNYGNLKLMGNLGITTQMTCLLVEPEKKFAMVVLSNLQMDMLVGAFKKIFGVVLGATEEPAAIQGPSAGEIGEITGTYLLHALDEAAEATAEIAEADGRLFIRLPGAGEIELQRTGTLEYRFLIPGARFPGDVLFEKDAAGKVRYMRYYWGAWERNN